MHPSRGSAGSQWKGHVRQKSFAKLAKCEVLTWRDELGGAVRNLGDPRQSELFDVFADILSRLLTGDSPVVGSMSFAIPF